MPITAPHPDDPEEAWDAFHESHGEPKLRMLLQNGGWPQTLHLKAVQWLARKDAERELRNESSQAEQTEIARSAKDAAWAAAAAASRAADAAQAANTRATIALIIAAISIIITAIAAISVHLDAIRGG